MKYEIEKMIGEIAKYDDGWSLELNKISWNDKPIKYDIRKWSNNHSKMSRGITLTKEETQNLNKSLNNIIPKLPKDFRKDHTLSFKILGHISKLGKTERLTKELNIISWNNGPAKYDIRDWTNNHLNMSPGITLTKEELNSLKVVLNQEFELDYATKKTIEEVKEMKFPSIDDIKKDYNEVNKIIKGNKDEKSIKAINKEYGIDYMLYHNEFDLYAVNYSKYGNLRNIFYNLKNDEVRFDVWLDEIDDNFIGEITIEELTQEEYDYCKEITIENTIELFKSKYENRSLLEKAPTTNKEKEYER